MTARSKIVQEIVNKIDSIPDNQLPQILSYVEKIASLNLIKEKQFILSYAGSWKNIDDELFADLTDNLHQNRLTESDDKLK